jgi:valyl-tRNA synthetase
VAFRNLRSEMKLDPKKKVAGELFVADGLTRGTVAEHQDGILRLAALSELKMLEGPIPEGSTMRSIHEFDVRIVYAAETVDAAVELARVRKDIERLTKDIASKERQLGDETFRSRAPEKIIRGMETTLGERRAELQRLMDRVAQIEKSVSSE